MCWMHETWYFYSLLFFFIFHESKQTLILFPHPVSAQTTSGTFQSSSIAHHIRLGTMQLSKISKEIRLKSEWNDINIHNLFFSMSTLFSTTAQWWKRSWIMRRPILSCSTSSSRWARWCRLIKYFLHL